MVIEIKRLSKTRELEKKYHSMINDIYRGRFRGSDFNCVKALMVFRFAKELEAMGEPLKHPGRRVYCDVYQEWVSVRASTRDFRKTGRSRRQARAHLWIIIEWFKAAVAYLLKL